MAGEQGERQTCMVCEQAPATRECPGCGLLTCLACDDGEGCYGGLAAQEEAICPEDVWGTAEEFEAAEAAKRSTDGDKHDDAD